MDCSERCLSAGRVFLEERKLEAEILSARMSRETGGAPFNRPIAGAGAIVRHYAADMILGVTIVEMLANVADSEGRW